MPVSTPIRSMKDRESLASNVYEISVPRAKRAFAVRGILQQWPC